MAAPSHYPMTLGRILTLGWSLFRYSWRTIIAASAVFLIPAYAVMMVAAVAYSPVANEWLGAVEAAQLRGLPVPPPPPGSEIAFLVLFGAGIVTLLGLMLAGAAVIHIVDHSYRGVRIGAGAAVRDAVGRFPALLSAQLLFLLAVILLLLLGVSVGAALFVGGGASAFAGLVVLVGTFAALIFASMRMTLVNPAVVIERAGGAEALARSWRLAAGSGWRILGYLLLIGLISTGLGLLLSLLPQVLLRLTPATPFDVAVATIIDAVAAILTVALSPIVITLLYYDLRWRRGETAPVPGGGETSAAVPATMPGPYPPGPPPL